GSHDAATVATVVAPPLPIVAALDPSLDLPTASFLEGAGEAIDECGAAASSSPQTDHSVEPGGASVRSHLLKRTLILLSAWLRHEGGEAGGRWPLAAGVTSTPATAARNHPFTRAIVCDSAALACG